MSAQRRQLTIMFCDLIGSTRRSTQVDPEILYEINDAFLTCCAKLIEDADGMIARYMGDGFLAYFGWPQTHEDDPERAVKVALSICRDVPQLPVHGPPLAVRVGIATGLVVLGEAIGKGQAREQPVTGEVPNLAARLMARASANGALVSDTTKVLASRRFQFRDAGALRLKGFDQAVQAWEPGLAVARPSPSAAHASPPGFVGRDRELQAMLTTFRACMDGKLQIVEIIGDAGLGKSRLIAEFRRSLKAYPHHWMEGHCANIFMNTPFFPMAQMIRHEDIGDVGQDAGGDHKLPADAAPLLAEFVGWNRGALDPPIGLVAEEGRARLVAVLIQWILATAEARPTVLVLEDAHWADPSTLELMAKVEGAAACSRLMIVYVRRPGADWPLAGPPPHDPILLGPLADTEVESLVRSALEGQGRPSGDLRKVLSRAQGVPLFAVELARFLESGRAGTIPATLSDLIMMRLDGLGSLKPLVQTASVFGDAFQTDELARMLDSPAGGLGRDLETLVEAGILSPQAEDGQNYAFRHTLIRDAACETLLIRRRRELHRLAAAAMAADGAGEFRHEAIARHWTVAGDAGKALTAWRSAASSALRRGAYREAQDSLERGVALLSGEPASLDRDEQELMLQGSLAEVLRVTKGYASPETAAATARARQLAEARGDPRRQFAHLSGEWMSASSSGDYHRAGPLAERLLLLAKARGDPANLGVAHMAALTLRHRIGDLIGAVQAFADGARFFAAPRFRRLSGAFVQTYGNAAIVSWSLGAPARARRQARRMLAFAAMTEQPYELAFAHYMAAVSAILLGSHRAALRNAGRAVALAEDKGFPQFAGVARVVMGRAMAELGDPGGGLEVAAAGFTIMAHSNNRAGLTMYIAWKAAIEALGGGFSTSVTTFGEALNANPLETYYRPEILRLRALSRLRLGDLAGARADFAAGLESARQIRSTFLHARLLESAAGTRLEAWRAPSSRRAEA